MNLLILSSGTRNKLVTYFKKEFHDVGKVICADCNPLAPTLYISDGYYIVPKIDNPNYIDVILDICKKEKIDGLFSLIDPELSLISKHKQKFLNLGIIPFVSDYEQVEMSFHKYKFYEFCIENGFNTVKTYKNLDEFKYHYNAKEIEFPVFVKPANGSCSTNIQKVENMEELEFIIMKYPDLIIQEFMKGQEIGADVYIDTISKKVVSIFTKKKLLMRAGETDKSVSFKNQNLFDTIRNFVEKAGYEGPIDIDIFEVEGKYYFSEVNPRFGGGYLNAYGAGCNFPTYMLKNLKKEINNDEIGVYDEGVYMLKYLDAIIQKLKN